jgi:hypothetical protein
MNNINPKSEIDHVDPVDQWNEILGDPLFTEVKKNITAIVSKNFKGLTISDAVSSIDTPKKTDCGDLCLIVNKLNKFVKFEKDSNKIVKEIQLLVKFFA